jgi:MFS family permease
MVYAVLVASAFLIEVALNEPLGSLPLALVRAHVPAGEIALVLGVGPIAALLVSVPIGGLADRFGRLPTIRIAACLCVISVGALAYGHDPVIIAVLMAMRGIAITAYVTAEFAYASAVVAPERAVSATATLGMVGNLSFATAPAAGFWLWQHGIERQQFLWSAGLALVGALMLSALPAESMRPVRRSRRIFMRSVWLPAITFLVACALAGGVNGALAIVTFHQRGIANGALLFTALASTTFVLRFLAGRLVERFGPRTIAVPTAIAQCVGSLLAAHAQTASAVIIAGLCMGIAWSAVVPVGIGLLFERSSRNTRGAAMGSYNLAFSIGMTVGSVIAAAAAAWGGGYTLAMSVCAAAALIALPLLFIVRPTRPLRAVVLVSPASRAEARA